MTNGQSDGDDLTPSQREFLDAALAEGEADIRAGRYVTLSSKEEIDEYFASILTGIKAKSV